VVDHYADQYWNDLPTVLSYLCRRATGDASLWWMDYLKRKHATPPRKRALVFACGTGWVERDLFDRGVAETFDAFDASSHYLAIAEKERAGRPISYSNSDFDEFVPRHKYDLIVNVAALHHVRYLFRMAHVLARALQPDGIFVHWEYVGPSRNQYSDRHLAVMQQINAGLPPRFRTRHPLRPDVATLLGGDPTEAIHAGDIRRALRNEFEMIEDHPLGGGIAYQILWNNLDEFRKGDDEANTTLERLLELDQSLTERGLVPPLFAFMICRPRPRPHWTSFIDRLVREPARETFAGFARGYYPGEAMRSSRLWRWAAGRAEARSPVRIDLDLP